MAQIEMKALAFTSDQENRALHSPRIPDFKIDVGFFEGEISDDKVRVTDSIHDSIDDVAVKDRLIHLLADVAATANRGINAELIHVLKLLCERHRHEDVFSLR